MSRADTISPTAPSAIKTTGGRDLRLDFFRGLALWFIFIDHIPSSYIGNLTFRNFGLSDATEIFVFISGYTAALVYGAALQKNGAAYMTMQVAKRVWQLYAAHILLFIFFIGQIFWVSNRFGNAAFLDELNVAAFLGNPMQSVLDALILRYRPVNLDVLPLYMVLLAGLPVALLLTRVSRVLTLALSIALWLGVQRYQWAFPEYEDGSTWYFNPLGWQLVFVIGILCASLRNQSSPWLKWRPWLAVIAFIDLVFSFTIAIAWKIPPLYQAIEPFVGSWLYPMIDKTNFAILRLLHFLATAYFVAHFIGPDSRILSWRLAKPVIICGQHSLHIFCLGISLSFLAHFVLVQFGRGLPMQLVVVFGGLCMMTALACQLQWYKTRSRSGGSRAERSPAAATPAGSNAAPSQATAHTKQAPASDTPIGPAPTAAPVRPSATAPGTDIDVPDAPPSDRRP
ncbi:MAG: OpgC domain-containing protein [Lautropia sp.]|nr:OpgC domain-containing protein [Lautropia sp.]